MTLGMRQLFAALVAVFATLALPVTATAQITLKDITGRDVTLQAPAKRIVLGDGRHIVVLGMLDPDPVARIVGWRQDKGLDPARMDAYRAAFPRIDQIAPVGAGNRQLSVEQTISIDPDLVILALVDAQDPQMQVPLAQLDAAGIPVIFVDFFSHPIDNTAASLAILGKALGAEARAAEVIAYYEARLDLIRDRLAETAPAKPRVFVQVHATPERCCDTVGAGVFDEFITAAGGQNVGQELVPGIMGNVGLENLIALDPDIFLASGGQHLRARGGLVLGAGVEADEATKSFKTLLSAPGLRDLRAVETGRATAFWHLFNDSPFHIALIEHLAKRFHPDLFADLDPEATMADMQARFSPVSVDGTWWLDAP